MLKERLYPNGFLRVMQFHMVGIPLAGSVFFAETDRALCGGRIDHAAFLEDFDLAGGHQPSGGLPGLFHVVTPLVIGEDFAGGFTGADRALTGSLIEEGKDGGFEFVPVPARL